MSTSVSDSDNDVLIGQTLIHWETLNRDDWVISGVKDKCRDFDIFNLCEAAACVVVLSSGFELRVDVQSVLIVKLLPGSGVL